MPFRPHIRGKQRHATARPRLVEDYESALSPDEFVKFVAKIRELDSAMGKYSEKMLPVEESYRKETRKHVVVAIPLKAGQIIGKQDITLRRADSDKMPSDLEDVVGKKTDKKYDINEVVFVENLL